MFLDVFRIYIRLRYFVCSQTADNFPLHAGCRSLHGPGAMAVQNYVRVSGDLSFKDCHTDGSVGALQTKSLQLRETSVLSFENVSSKESIGALHVQGQTESRGTILFRSTRSESNTGAMLAEGQLQLISAVMRFSNCTARGSSGAATMKKGMMISADASVFFETRNFRG